MWESRWPSWAVRPSELSGFRGYIEPCFGIGHSLCLICQLTSEDIKHHFIIIASVDVKFTSCVRVEVAVRPNEPSGFRGRKELLNRASALVTTCP